MYPTLSLHTYMKKVCFPSKKRVYYTLRIILSTTKQMIIIELYLWQRFLLVRSVDRVELDYIW